MGANKRPRKKRDQMVGFLVCGREKVENLIPPNCTISTYAFLVCPLFTLIIVSANQYFILKAREALMEMPNTPKSYGCLISWW